MNLIGDRKANVTEFLKTHIKQVCVENEMQSNLDVCFSMKFITFLLSNQECFICLLVCVFIICIIFFSRVT